jgi:predicted dehydrogenase
MLSLSLYHDIWRNGLVGCRAGEAQQQPLPMPDDIMPTIPRDVSTDEKREAAHQAFLLQSPSLVRAFLDCLANDTLPEPDFAAGHETQRVMDAVLLSADERRWVEISEFA